MSWGGGFGPWGPGSGKPGGGRRGGQGAGGGLDEALARFQAMLRRFAPGGRQPRVWWLALLAIVLIWLGSGFYRVQPDEEGVVLRFGAFARATPPGLNYHLPWPIESVLLPAVTRINRIEIGYRSGASGTSNVIAESQMLTGDANIVEVNFAIFWRIRDARDFLFNIRHPASTIKAVGESVMREVIGRTQLEPALTSARAEIEQEVQQHVQAILDQYSAGVDLVAVQLQRVDPPPQVVDAFIDVQRAYTDAERMVNEAKGYANKVVPTARGDAAQIVAAAQGEMQATVAQASGEAKRFLSVLAAYRTARSITLRRLYIETMQQVLSHTPVTIVDPRLPGMLGLLSLNPAAAVPGAKP